MINLYGGVDMGTSKIKTGKLEDIICSIRSEKDAENYIRKYT